MIQATIAGIALGLLLIISVSPVVFAVIKYSINKGRAGGFSFAGGVLLSDVLWVILSNLFSQAVVQLLDFKKEIAIFGSIFLTAIGIYYLFFKKVHLIEDENKISIKTSTHIKLITSGFLINSLNPTLILFWLTTATTLAATNTLQQRIIIFTVALLINTGFDIIKVVLAGKIRNRLNEKNILIINRISGSILLLFGVALLIGAISNVKVLH